MKRALLALALALLASSPAWSASSLAPDLDATRFVADSARFDRAYIPTLAVTSDEKAAPSVRAMALLNATWKEFRGAWYDAAPADPQWRADFDAIAGRIAAADAIVARGTELVKAHEELEHVRLTLLALRTRHGIAHYTDLLTRFHEDMETIVLAAKGKTPETLTAADLQRIRDHLPGALAVWRDVLAAPLDGALYGMDDQATAAVRAALLAEQQALEALQARLQEGSVQSVIASAVALKPPFARTFKFFGDFSRVL